MRVCLLAFFAIEAQRNRALLVQDRNPNDEASWDLSCGTLLALVGKC
jgi:hypothetical protein